MTAIIGQYFKRGSSDRYSATLIIKSGRYQLEYDNSVVEGLDPELLKISDRVGNIQRRIRFPDGAVFVTDDNDALDSVLEKQSHTAHRGALLHKVESRWRWVVAALVVTMLFSTALVRWGLPATSRYLAFNIPVEVNQYVSTQTLEVLDRFMLEASDLSQAERTRQMKRFHDITSSLKDSEHRYTLHFRKLPDAIPNAFALPSGDIVLTDALVNMATDQQEIDSVLLHEIAHVEHRHSQQQVVSGSIVSIVTAYITGGLSGGEELLTGMPVFMMQQSYSRKFETQADDFAFAKMLELGMDPGCFGTMISKIGGIEAHEHEDAEEPMSFLSSHPATGNRAQKAREQARLAGIKPVCR